MAQQAAEDKAYPRKPQQQGRVDVHVEEMPDLNLAPMVADDKPMQDIVPKEEEEEEEQQQAEEASAKALPYRSKHFYRDYLCRTLKTLQYLYAFAMLGFIISSLGPLLLLLGRQVGEEHSLMNTLFTLRGFGYAAASVVVGKVFDLLTQPHFVRSSKATLAASRIRRWLTVHPFDTHYLVAHLFIVLSLVALTALHMVLPFMKSFAMLAVVTVCIGVMSSVLDMGGNVLIIRIWRENVNPFMQTLHLAFGIGALACPLLISFMVDVLQWTMISVYFVIALFIGSSALFFMAVQCLLYIVVPISMQREIRLKQTMPDGEKGKVEMREPHARDGNMEGNDATIEAQTLDESPWWKSMSPAALWKRVTDRTTVVALFIAAAMFCVVGLEVVYGGMVYSYVVLSGMGTEMEAALINSVYWLAFTVGRVAAVFISLKLKPKTMLVIDIIGCITATVILLTLSRVHIGFIWLGSIIIGMAMASQFPCCISFPVSEPRLAIKEVSGGMTSIIVIGASMGEMVVPLVVSVSDLILGLNSMLWTLLFVSLVTTIVYGCTWFYIRWAGDKIHAEANGTDAGIAHSRDEFQALDEDQDNIDDEKKVAKNTENYR